MAEWLRLHDEFVPQGCRKVDDLKVSIFDSVSGALFFKIPVEHFSTCKSTSTEDQLIVELDKAKALAQTLALSTVTFKTNEFILQNCRKMDDLEFESWRL